jgi:hypothetical protein
MKREAIFKKQFRKDLERISASAETPPDFWKSSIC